jgi:hypothetical protein
MCGDILVVMSIKRNVIHRLGQAILERKGETNLQRDA